MPRRPPMPAPVQYLLWPAAELRGPATVIVCALSKPGSPFVVSVLPSNVPSVYPKPKLQSAYRMARLPAAAGAPSKPWPSPTSLLEPPGLVANCTCCKSRSRSNHGATIHLAFQSGLGPRTETLLLRFPPQHSPELIRKRIRARPGTPSLGSAKLVTETLKPVCISSQRSGRSTSHSLRQRRYRPRHGTDL